MIKGKLSYLNRLNSKYSFRYSMDAQQVSGASPPSIFIGRKGYPKVYVGPLVPAVHGDTSTMDTPERWQGKTAEDVIDFRLQLVRGKQLVGIRDLDKTQLVRDIALAKDPVSMDVEFENKPRGIFFHEDMQPFGPSGQIKTVEASVGKYDQRMEKAYYDTDLLAKDAVTTLYEKGVLISSLQKAFSTGAFGMDRKLVPTRWSITAVDDTLGKYLLDDIRSYPILDMYQVYEFGAMNNYFVVLLMPTLWQYESIEAFMKIFGNEEVVFSDWEPHEGKKEYATIGGCYYSGRLAIAEKLKEMKVQAGAIIFREAYTGYIPLGVWLVRENMRQAMKTKPEEFCDMNSALTHISLKLRLPFQRYRQISILLKQRKISDFLK